MKEVPIKNAVEHDKDWSKYKIPKDAKFLILDIKSRDITFLVPKKKE